MNAHPGQQHHRYPRRVTTALVGVIMTILLAACGIPTDSSPHMIPRANVPFHILSSGSAPSTTTTTLPPTVAVPETIYMVDSTQHVTAVTRDVVLPATLSQIVGALLDGPTAAESSAGLQSFLTGRPGDVSVTVTNGIATVNFATNPVQVVGPDQILAVAQVVFTVTQQPGISGVVFHIAGQPIEVPTAAGAQVPGPVSRTTYGSQAPVSTTPPAG